MKRFRSSRDNCKDYELHFVPSIFVTKHTETRTFSCHVYFMYMLSQVIEFLTTQEPFLFDTNPNRGSPITMLKGESYNFLFKLHSKDPLFFHLCKAKNSFQHDIKMKNKMDMQTTPNLYETTFLMIQKVCFFPALSCLYFY